MPSISTITPATFDSGRSVTLTGEGFGAAQGSVLIGGVSQNVSTWTDTSISFTTARGSQSLGACRVDVVKGATSAAAFFTDGFESGDLSHTENGAFWYTPNTGSDDDVSVVAGRGNPGKSLQFTFTAEPDLALYGFAEARFSLGADYTELTIAFDLYIPSGAEGWGSAAYAHRDSTGSDNNKFFRLWPSTGDTDREEVGASLFLNSVPDGYSAIRNEWNVPQPDASNMTERGQAKASFISAADLGTWIAVKLYCKAATATTNGTLRIYKNGTLLIDNSETVANYNAASPHSWRYGYLLGFANSGFTNTTMLQIDNVRFYAGAA